jgi:3-amino-4-hydroxybenzoic acid synthase
VKFVWIDLRSVPTSHREAVADAAIHARVDAIVDSDPATLATLPATVKRVFVGDATPEQVVGDDLILLREVAGPDQLATLHTCHRNGEQNTAALVNVIDDSTLTLACEAAIALPYTVVQFRDPTKIPLEIVIAAADTSPGQLICKADNLEEAQIIIDVLEKGSEGVLMAPRDAGDVFTLVQMLRTKTPQLSLAKLIVDSIEHLGLGDRVCIDTCTYFEEDEGMLVGSYAH